MTNELRTLDAVNIRIAHELAADGRVSNREIARRLGLSEGSVRQRIGRMKRAGLLRVVGQTNLEAAPESFLAIVGLKIDGRRLETCARRIEALPSVISTMIVTGRHDLMVVVLATAPQTLVDFVTRDLAGVPGVRDSETNVVLRGYGQWLDPRRLFPPAGGGAGPKKPSQRKRERSP
jgi:Lrp/AsnC family transcriptional regulator for asnA, asnC and gidA